MSFQNNHTFQNPLRCSVAVIGGGVAGMEAAITLGKIGIKTCLIEQAPYLGGAIRNYASTFPAGESGDDIVLRYSESFKKTAVSLILGQPISSCIEHSGNYTISLSNNQTIHTKAIVLATGLDLFDTSKKEEYGYGIYNRVTTSGQLEMILSGNAQHIALDTIKTAAFVHCVGSRDLKAGRPYCSKLCCATAIKQAMQLFRLIPNISIYSFYIDLRLNEPYMETMYRQAQELAAVRFIRGKVSEVAEVADGRLAIKAEDTLLGRPVRLTADLLVLMAGCEPSAGTRQLCGQLQMERSPEGFVAMGEPESGLCATTRKGVFVAGSAAGPMSIAQSAAHGRAAAVEAAAYCNQNEPIFNGQ